MTGAGAFGVSAGSAEIAPEPKRTRHTASPRMRRRLREMGVDEAVLTAPAPTHSAVAAPSTGSVAFVSVLVDFGAVRAIRASLGPEWVQREGFELDHLPFVCRAVVEAIDRFPGISGGNAASRAVTLDLDGHVFTDVRDMRVAAFARDMQRPSRADLPESATFLIKHTGAHGSYLSRPAIPPGFASVLTLDAIIATPVAVGADDSQAIGIRPIANMSLSYDARLIDDLLAAQFLQQVKQAIETVDWSGEV